MKKRKIISLIAAAALTLGMFSGCGGSKNQTVAEDPNTVPDDTYEINWYFYGDSLKDTASVEAKVNEYLKDKINATLKINRLEMSQYQEKMNAMISSGEYFDIAFCANWMLKYRDNAVNGAWYPLDDDIKKYMPETYAMIGDEIMNNTRVNGKMYAVPANKEFAESRGWAYRKDIADKYNIDMDKIKTFEDLEPVLQLIKDNEPDIQYPIDWSSDRTPVAMLPYEQIIPQVAIFYDRYLGKVVNLIETPEYAEAAMVARRFYEKGFVKKDIMTAKDFSQRLKDGKIFCYIEFLKPGKAQEVSKNFPFPLAQAEVTPRIELNGAGTGSMMAISRTSKNPVRVMRFLELLNTDKYLNNLINYGIEGKHYTKIDENTIDVMPNASYTLQGYQWMTGNVFLNYLTKGEAPDKMQQLAEFNKSAAKPEQYGFLYDPEPVQQEIAACGALSKEFSEQISMGGVDPLPKIEEYKARLKVAGIDKIVDELQKQYDEFLANKK